MSLFAVDIGNTDIHAGIRHPAGDGWSKILRFPSRSANTTDKWYSMFSPHLAGLLELPTPLRIVACSVVPALTQSFTGFTSRYLDLDPLMVSASIDLGITVATDQPLQTGADRIANAAAAYAEFGGPVIVVDAGTATKVDAVTPNGKFLGGAIAPGLGMSMDALARGAAQLYAVPLEAPSHAIGHNTVDAVQSGVVLGHVHTVDGLVRQISLELGGANAILVTGGFSDLIRPHLRTDTHHRPNLTLDGLEVIASRNPSPPENHSSQTARFV
jgi:type III pantothenate kinase